MRRWPRDRIDCSYMANERWRGWGLDDEHTLVIGRIAVAFGNIEFLVDNMLLPLIGPDGWAGRLVAGGESLNWQLQRIERLAPFRVDAETAVEVKEWLGVVRAASDKRNRVLHNAWHQSAERLIKLGFRRGEFDDHKATLEELNAFAEELADLTDSTFDLMSRTSKMVWPELLSDD